MLPNPTPTRETDIKTQCAGEQDRPSLRFTEADPHTCDQTSQVQEAQERCKKETQLKIAKTQGLTANKIKNNSKTEPLGAKTLTGKDRLLQKAKAS